MARDGGTRERPGEFGNPPGPFNIGWSAGLSPGPHFFWKTSLAMPTAVTALGQPE